MSNKVKVRKQLSGYSTGITKLSTGAVNLEGIIKNFKGTKIVIDIENDQLEVHYKEEIIKSDGSVDSTKTKIEYLSDLPEEGEADTGEDGLPIMETYVKTKDESLIVTGWNDKIGGDILPDNLDFIKKTEGII